MTPQERLFRLCVLEAWNERVALGLWTPEEYGAAVAEAVRHEDEQENDR